MNNVSSYDLNNLRQLDSIRGLMAVAILGCHFLAAFSYRLPTLGVFQPFKVLFNAQTGLCYFFVLSGFVITYSLLTQKNISFWKFLIKRFLRLLPPVFLSIIVLYSYIILFGQPEIGTLYSDSQWLQDTLFLKGASINPFYDIFVNTYIVGDVFYNGNLWAIRYEFLVPLLILFILSFFTNKKIALSSILFVLGLIISLGGAEKRVFYIGCMLFGSFLCVVLDSIDYHKYKSWVLVVLISTFVFSNIFIPTDSILVMRLLNFFLVLTVIIYIVNDNGTNKVRLLNLRILRFLGRISYEIYCYHLFFIIIVGCPLYESLKLYVNHNLAVVFAYFTVLGLTILASFFSNKYATPINNSLIKMVLK